MKPLFFLVVVACDKLIDVSKLHSLDWKHKGEIEDGVSKFYDWYKDNLS